MEEKKKYNIREILEFAPLGLRLYSPMFGVVFLEDVNDSDDYPIEVKADICYETFTKYGLYTIDYPNAECCLLPSKDCRDWGEWQWELLEDGDLVTNTETGVVMKVAHTNNGMKWIDSHGMEGYFTDELMKLVRYASPIEKEKYVDAKSKYKGLVRDVSDIDISFGAADSDLKEFTWTIPDGFSAKVHNGKVYVFALPDRFSIHKGDWFVCIKGCDGFDVEKMYRSMTDGHINNEDGMVANFNDDHIAEYFRPANSMFDDIPSLPKFNAGDWILHQGTDNAFKVLEINGDTYKLMTVDGDTSNVNYNDVDRNARLWKIDDAKHGDVIFFDGGVGIFKEISSEMKDHIISPCYWDIENGHLYHSDHHWMVGKDVHPATKMERSTLFQKIREHGFRWYDREKKLVEVFHFKQGNYYVCKQDCHFGNENINYRHGEIYLCPKLNFLYDDNQESIDWSCIGDFAANYFDEVKDNPDLPF